MPRERNDEYDYEQGFRPVKAERDVDADMESARDEAEIHLEKMQYSDAGVQRLADALDPTKFNDIWKKVN